MIWGVTAEEPPVLITAIELNKASATIGVGGSETLNATLTPSNATETVVWESSDESVATVSGGTVTGVAAGTATITAKSPSDGTIKATCEVTVTAPVAVTGVSLDKTSVTLHASETETLTPIFTPSDATNKNVAWESDDEDVATVAGGVVTAVGVGTATITVTTEDGSKTATCAVTVSPVSVTGVTLKSATTIKAGKTETLTPTIAPTNATDQAVSWESDDETVATVSAAGVVTGVAAGTANITVTTHDGSYTASCEVTVENVGDGTSSNPYTVGEVIDGTATSGNKYVKGYIVGFIENSKISQSLGNTNWALADSKEETVYNNTIPVELSSTYRDTYGLGNHSDLLGAYVVVKGSITSYFSKTGVKSLSEITAKKEVEISSANYATFSSTNAVDFSATGVTVYKAKVTGDYVKMTEVSDGKVPASTGVILYNASAGTYMPTVIASTDALSDTTTTRTEVNKTGGAGYNYILQSDGVGGIVFNMASADGTYYMPAGRAYLSTTVDASASGARLSVKFDDEEITGINASLAKGERENNAIFNLNGQRVEKAQKGLYIVNGKKCVIR